MLAEYVSIDEHYAGEVMNTDNSEMEQQLIDQFQHKFSEITSLEIRCITVYDNLKPQS